MASGSQHTTYICLESQYGACSVSPVWSLLQLRTNTVQLKKDVLKIDEPTADRQHKDSRHGARKVEGEITLYLRYGNYDTVLEALLGGTWAPKATKTAVTLSAAAADNSFNDSGNGFITAGFEVGDIVNVTGFTGSVANNIARGVLTAVSAGKLTVAGADGDAIVDDAAGESVTISTVKQVLKAGTARRSYTMLRKYADIADKPFHFFDGIEFNSMSIALKANAAVEVTIGVVGHDLTTSATDKAGATYVAEALNAPVDGFSGVFKEGGLVASSVSEITVTLNNGLSPLFVLGSKNTILPSEGMSTVEGSASVYFLNNTMLDKFINETESKAEMGMPDGAGNLLTLKLPRIKYNGGSADVKGDGPILPQMPIEALYDSMTATNVLFERTPHA